MGLQDKLTAARAAILRQYEQMTSEHMDEKDLLLDDEVMALVVDFDIALA